MTSHWLKTLFLALALVSGGCAAESPELAQDEEVDEVRSAAYERLVGAWQGEEGWLQNVVFTETVEGRGRHYFAERTITCITTPCDPIREEGTYRATSRYLYLTQGGVTERFSTTFRDDVLTLRSGTRVVYRLRRIASYCREVSDCADQSYPVIQCVGTDTCASNRCGRVCGPVATGCTSNAECATSQYCATSTCGGAGTCSARPEACNTLYNPVCGCDGRTYGNSCSAASAGVSVASTGECVSVGAGGACTSDSQCGDLYFCDRPGCGTSGTCRTGSTIRCSSVYEPVCGCDGVTYSNACMAIVGSASVAHEGACR